MIFFVFRIFELYWINLLHIYQPPTQKERIIKKIAKEAYGPIAEGLKKHPAAKFVLNINASLTEQLAAYGFEWILNEYRAAAERGQIEFTGSAAYHAILPLLPEKEVVRQIELNATINRRYFGDAYKPKGFFSPEMCYSLPLAHIVRRLGFQWFIMDEIGATGKFGELDFRYLYNLENVSDFFVLFRNRKVSDKAAIAPIHSPKKFSEILRLGKGAYVVLAIDGEAFGHHKKDFDKMLFATYDYLAEEKVLEPILISDLLGQKMQRKYIGPLPCSWASMEGDLKDGLPYGLWYNPKNDIHIQQWDFTNFSIRCLEISAKNTKEYEQNEQWSRARAMLDKALYSDQYWWAGGRKGFGTISIQWLPQMIFAGAELMREVVKTAPNLDARYGAEAIERYQKIEETVKYWNRNRIYNKYKKKNL